MARLFHYRVIEADGREQRGAAEMSEPPTMGELHALVESHLNAPMFRITVKRVGDGTQAMFIEELAEIKELPRNEKATAIYREQWMADHPKADAEQMPAIYGTAILFYDLK